MYWPLHRITFLLGISFFDRAQELACYGTVSPILFQELHLQCQRGGPSVFLIGIVYLGTGWIGLQEKRQRYDFSLVNLGTWGYVLWLGPTTHEEHSQHH